MEITKTAIAAVVLGAKHDFKSTNLFQKLAKMRSLEKQSKVYV